MQKHKTIWGITAISLIILLSGCTTAKPDSFSNELCRSFEQWQYIQIVNPEAPEKPEPPEGMPGVIAEKIYDKYKNRF